MEAYKQRVVETRKKELGQAYSRSSLGMPAQIQSPLADLLIERYMYIHVPYIYTVP